MDCLIGFIGLSGKGGEAAESGLYVDALPDISIAFIEKLVAENETAADLWQTIEKRAILKFRTLFVSEINRTHKISKIDVCECLICENKSLLATALWYLCGAELMYERATSNRLNAYTTIDRQKAKEMRDEFMKLFHEELSVAVAGIDIHSSECIECVQPAEILGQIQPII